MMMKLLRCKMLLLAIFHFSCCFLLSSAITSSSSSSSRTTLTRKRRRQNNLIRNNNESLSLSLSSSKKLFTISGGSIEILDRITTSTDTDDDVDDDKNKLVRKSNPTISQRIFSPFRTQNSNDNNQQQNQQIIKQQSRDKSSTGIDHKKKNDGNDAKMTSLTRIIRTIYPKNNKYWLAKKLVLDMLLISVVFIIGSTSKEDGLIPLTILAQIFMYHEMIYVLDGKTNFVNDVNEGGVRASTAPTRRRRIVNSFHQWWWLIIGLLTVDGPRLMPWMATHFSIISFGMIISSIGYIMIDLQYHHHHQNHEEQFSYDDNVSDTMTTTTRTKLETLKRDYFQQISISLMGLLLVVTPSSFWISTMEEYGMRWVVQPFTLVVINSFITDLIDHVATTSRKLDTTSTTATATTTTTTTSWHHKMIPSISPTKTWEGFIVATVLSLIVARYLLTNQWNVDENGLNYQNNNIDVIAVAAFASVIGPIGGYFVTLLRNVYYQQEEDLNNNNNNNNKSQPDKQKNVGKLLLVLLDRLDRQLLVAPCVYLYLELTRNSGKISNTELLSHFPIMSDNKG